jgi:hypothetical protein
MNNTDERSPALRCADIAVTAWADAVRHQLEEPSRHADFYALAREVVATLCALDDLAVLLAAQVGRYGESRVLYDDTRAVDPVARLTEAVQCLRDVRAALGPATVAANSFWTAIGHIGVEAAP